MVGSGPSAAEGWYSRNGEYALYGERRVGDWEYRWGRCAAHLGTVSVVQASVTVRCVLYLRNSPLDTAQRA